MIDQHPLPTTAPLVPDAIGSGAELHPWCQRLLTPLAEQPALTSSAPGSPIMTESFLTDTRWEYIETAMLKLGSLQHEQVDIPLVCEFALQLLEQSSKDLRLVTQLLRALLQTADATDLTLALQLLQLWLQHYAAPSASATGHRQQRLLQQNLQRLQTASWRLEPLPAQQRQLLEHHARRLEDLCLADDNTLLAAASQQLRQAIQQLPHQDPEAAVSSNTHPAATIFAVAPEEMTSSPTTEPPVSLPVINLESMTAFATADPQPSRARRQTLLELAEQLIQQDTAHPIGYRLRRYALWSGIETLPSHSAQQRTQLAAPDADRRHDYRQGLATPTAALWQQIEQSLTLSPFWLEGHWLSAQAARSLGYPAIARAIAEELHQLLQRLPGLEHLAFADGTPLLSPEVAQWLHHSSPIATTSSEGKPLPADVASIEQALQHSSSPEQQFQLLLGMALYMEQEQKTAIAAHYYRLLQQHARQLSLAEWNPQLLAQLAAHCQRCPIPEPHD